MKTKGLQGKKERDRGTERGRKAYVMYVNVYFA
jgi:hypothetical protein